MCCFLRAWLVPTGWTMCLSSGLIEHIATAVWSHLLVSMPWSGVLLHWLCLLSCKKGNLANETIEEMSCKYRHMETACTLEFVLLLRDRAYHFVAWCEKHSPVIPVPLDSSYLTIRTVRCYFGPGSFHLGCSCFHIPCVIHPSGVSLNVTFPKTLPDTPSEPGPLGISSHQTLYFSFIVMPQLVFNVFNCAIIGLTSSKLPKGTEQIYSPWIIADP